MFRKIRETVENLLSSLEARTGDPSEELNRLLASMREELIEAKAGLPKLEEHIESLRAARAAELARAEDCVRRAGQAAAIDDSETVEVARRFEARHRERVKVYDRKIEAARGELALQQQTIRDMTEQFKQAMARREALAVRARRAAAASDLTDTGPSSLEEFDRLVEEIEGESELGSAERELDEELEGGSGRPGVEPLDRDRLADSQLEELKRRMREEGDGEA